MRRVQLDHGPRKEFSCHQLAVQNLRYRWTSGEICKKNILETQGYGSAVENKNKGQGTRSVNYIGEESDEKDSEKHEEQRKLRIDGKGNKPFYMEGLMCGNHFKAIIDTGSPVFSLFSFTKRDLHKVVDERKVVIRDMIGVERYVDYNEQTLELVGYQFVGLEVVGVTVSKARVLVAPNSRKLILGRDWLVALRYNINQPIEKKR